MIYLITGKPGAGKTLYAVSRYIATILGGKPGQVEGRRVIVGGVTDLLIEHELCSVPSFDPEAPAAKLEDRAPGDPPMEVEYSASTWWQWCRPGDLIVIDECQKLFRPMASGKRLPMHISKLETHRHYGIDILLITQHPRLVHSNVRDLVNVYSDVRRLYGSGTTIVYTWDHCTNPDRVANAQKQIVRHDKAAFSLYKSAEIHTKPRIKVPALLFIVPLAFVAVGLVATYAIGNFQKSMELDLAVSKPASAPALPGIAPGRIAQAQQPVQAVDQAHGVCAVDHAACRCVTQSDVWAVPLADPVCRSPGITYRQVEPGPAWSKLPTMSSHQAGDLAGAARAALRVSS